MIRSLEADALMSWKMTSGPTQEGSATGKLGTSYAQESVVPILVELGIADLTDVIASIAGSLNAFDVLRLTEVELVERCRVPRMTARKLRRRALQLVKDQREEDGGGGRGTTMSPPPPLTHNDDDDKSESGGKSNVSSSGADSNSSRVVKEPSKFSFDRTLRSHNSFGESPRTPQQQLTHRDFNTNTITNSGGLLASKKTLVHQMHTFTPKVRKTKSAARLFY
jgi:hypothetical protein